MTYNKLLFSIILFQSLISNSFVYGNAIKKDNLDTVTETPVVVDQSALVVQIERGNFVDVSTVFVQDPLHRIVEVPGEPEKQTNLDAVAYSLVNPPTIPDTVDGVDKNTTSDIIVNVNIIPSDIPTSTSTSTTTTTPKPLIITAVNNIIIKENISSKVENLPLPETSPITPTEDNFHTVTLNAVAEENAQLIQATTPETTPLPEDVNVLNDPLPSDLPPTPTQKLIPIKGQEEVIHGSYGDVSTTKNEEKEQNNKTIEEPEDIELCLGNRHLLPRIVVNSLERQKRKLSRLINRINDQQKQHCRPDRSRYQVEYHKCPLWRSEKMTYFYQYMRLVYCDDYDKYPDSNKFKRTYGPQLSLYEKINIFLILFSSIFITNLASTYRDDDNILDIFMNEKSDDLSGFFKELDDTSNIWAVLVAGSNGWYNYRHQADVSHAYHVLRRHGVNQNNIITMMYDDIAYNKENPYKGKIYNIPEGDDVYKGVKIDYRRDDVSPENFLAIIEGNKSKVKGGNGRVVESNKNDKIFIFFSDHGATGLVSFPSSILTVKDLNNSLKKMHTRQKYKELVFYLEACESGSMFEKVLSNDINIYAVTAANSDESSMGCFCDNKMNLPCLGDTFSVSWIVDSEYENLNTETLEKQYEIVKKLTNESHVMHYGDLNIAREHVSEFQGHTSTRHNIFYSQMKRLNIETKLQTSVQYNSRDIPLIMLEKAYIQSIGKNNTKEAKLAYLDAVNKREYLKKYMHKIVRHIIPDISTRNKVVRKRQNNSVDNIDCHDTVVKFFHKHCFNFNKNPYAMKYVYILSNLCSLNIDVTIIKNGLLEACGKIHITTDII
uniref:legumain n=1 Tax=Parastrongyloides trichosuri TaxID=131310 RepID=A0A0N4Z5T4_PARTI